MDFLTRIGVALHHQTPDRVPFAAYDNLVPRGEFARALENRGMGYCYRRSAVYAEMPNVSVETRSRDGVTTTIYHTPVGDASTLTSMHAGRIADSLSVETEGLIKSVDDYEPVIFMIDALSDPPQRWWRTDLDPWAFVHFLWLLCQGPVLRADQRNDVTFFRRPVCCI